MNTTRTENTLAHTRMFWLWAIGIAAIALMWMVFSKYAVPPLITSAYWHESFPVFNRIISGQNSHSLSEYLADWERLRRSVFECLIVLGVAVFSLLLLVAGLKKCAPAGRVRSKAHVQPKHFWGLLALSLCGMAISTVGIAWAIDHPFPVGWDEGVYINLANIDMLSFKANGLPGFLKSIIELDPPRPPAFRVVAFPITMIFGPHPHVLRLVSLLSFPLSAICVYLAADEIAGTLAGVFAAMFFMTSLAVVEASRFFGTEYALYLATSLTIYFLFRSWNVPEERTRDWIGLGLALGLGAWAKTSFLLVGGPILLVALILSSYKVIAGPSPLFLSKAAALGTALALPWWAPNYRAALAFARFSQDWARWSLGPPSLAILPKWISKFAFRGIGLPSALLMACLLIVMFVQKLRSRQTGMDLTQISAVWICVAGGLPLVVAQLLGNNHLMRIISPSLIPLAIALGVIVGAASRTHSRRVLAGITLIFCLQLIVAISNESQYYFNRTVDAEQWDWDRLHEICKDKQISNPLIAYLGSDGNVQFSSNRLSLDPSR